MALLNREKLPGASSTLSEDNGIDEAQSNLAHCLESYDRKGEAGLQEALDQIYPPTGQFRIPIPGWEGSYARIDTRHPSKTREATPAEKT